MSMYLEYENNMAHYPPFYLCIHIYYFFLFLFFFSGSGRALWRALVVKFEFTRSCVVNSYYPRLLALKSYVEQAQANPASTGERDGMSARGDFTQCF